MTTLIIHAGMPKAGSTALQSRLNSQRAALRRHGILYPTKMLNHNFLMAGVAPLQQLPRIFRQYYQENESALDGDFQSFWTKIRDQIDRAKPDVVVMSGENLWALTSEGAINLRKKLEMISSDIHVVCYVRRPSDFFLSMMQQQLKASHIVPKLKGVIYRRNLENLSGLSAMLHVHPYDREAFVEGDVCLDFAEKHLGGSNRLRAPSQEVSHNESICAEAMAILQEYRLCAHPDRASHFTKDTNFLIRELRELSQGERPRLRPKVKRLIDQSSPDLRWLRNMYGITFADVDYGKISRVEPVDVKSIDELCVVDEAKKLVMTNMLLKRAYSDRNEDTMSFRTLYKRKTKSGDEAVLVASRDASPSAS